MAFDKTAPHEQLLSLIRKLPATEVQNKLMAATDRELALSLMYVQEGDRNFVLSYVGKQKMDRTREELRLQEQVRITYAQYARSIANVIDRLRSAGPRDSMKSYLRPVRQSRNKKR